MISYKPKIIYRLPGKVKLMTDLTTHNWNNIWYDPIDESGKSVGKLSTLDIISYLKVYNCVQTNEYSAIFLMQGKLKI